VPLQSITNLLCISPTREEKNSYDVYAAFRVFRE